VAKVAVLMCISRFLVSGFNSRMGDDSFGLSA
jgi:hypothetical protein